MLFFCAVAVQVDAPVSPPDALPGHALPCECWPALWPDQKNSGQRKGKGGKGAWGEGRDTTEGERGKDRGGERDGRQEGKGEGRSRAMGQGRS